ncbi:MAG: hypothetical protein H6662_07085 [Ardenticatenaceae bacterium]|nr:hypothetical protein [Anaerolineales bacterium]MCB8921331.1 hypothetical protein [Ardenticatenaceae bacterium]MCB9004046.1 hypothetical protein [Ardenticatenaceae bacterium]
MNTGYLHPLYMHALSEFGTPHALPLSGGWLLEREIGNGRYTDAMGSYPIFTCQNWNCLREDLDALPKDLVSIALVTDPFGEYDKSYLQDCFPDLILPFKKHYVVNLSDAPHNKINKRHRAYARQALRYLCIELIANPPAYLDEWDVLYNNLIQRHQLHGMHSFSRESFAWQLQVPGLAGFRAEYRGETAGMLWCYQQGDIVYAHLNAMSELGYDLHASYALHWAAIAYLAGHAQWLDLGGGAGVHCNGRDGLSQFKRGWTSETRMAYFGGRIINRTAYASLTQANRLPPTCYFPAYRQGEFL